MSADPKGGAELDRLFRLDGKVAVITGASQNIGLATARLFAAAGCNLVLTARRLEPLEAVANQIRTQNGVRVLPLASDITKSTDRAALVRQSLEMFEHVDVLVNNAFAGSAFLRADGGKAPEPVSPLDQDVSVWEAGFQGNILGPVELARGFAPGMFAAGAGAIVNALSSAAFRPVRGQAAYGVTKAALEMLTRYLAQDLGPLIRVNSYSPGTIFERGAPVSDRRKPLINNIPLGRFGVAEECAAAALFLASPASSFTTGQTIFVDGGSFNVGRVGYPPRQTS